MPRWFDDACHADPHRQTALGRTALAVIAIYTIAAVAGWAVLGVIAAWLLL